MIDAHCHLDAYSDPLRISQVVERAKVFTIAVTNCPSDFARAYPHIRRFRSIRLALGLHPLLGPHHVNERRRFGSYLDRTSYIGEVGLDFSAEGLSTRTEQVASFRHVLALLQDNPRFLSVHSRRAESAVLDLLEEFKVGPVVFHWYSGPLSQLDRLLKQGHACSVNVAMLRTERGKSILNRLPPERVLTETDGPFVRLSGEPIAPGQVSKVLEFLTSLWGMPEREVSRRIRDNLRSLIPGQPPSQDVRQIQ